MSRASDSRLTGRPVRRRGLPMSSSPRRRERLPVSRSRDPSWEVGTSGSITPSRELSAMEVVVVGSAEVGVGVVEAGSTGVAGGEASVIVGDVEVDVVGSATVAEVGVVVEDAELPEGESYGNAMLLCEVMLSDMT